MSLLLVNYGCTSTLFCIFDSISTSDPHAQTVECLPGEYPAPTSDLMAGSVVYAYPSCTKCPKGHYQSVDGQAHCNPCPTGHYQPSTGQTACEPCAAGYYQMLTGQDYCLQCPEGSIAEGTGATSCRGVCMYMS